MNRLREVIENNFWTYFIYFTVQ